jgi:hypothetical protein
MLGKKYEVSVVPVAKSGQPFLDTISRRNDPDRRILLFDDPSRWLITKR